MAARPLDQLLAVFLPGRRLAARLNVGTFVEALAKTQPQLTLGRQSQGREKRIGVVWNDGDDMRPGTLRRVGLERRPIPIALEPGDRHRSELEESAHRARRPPRQLHAGGDLYGSFVRSIT